MYGEFDIVVLLLPHCVFSAAFGVFMDRMKMTELPSPGAVEAAYDFIRVLSDLYDNKVSLYDVALHE